MSLSQKIVFKLVTKLYEKGVQPFTTSKVWKDQSLFKLFIEAAWYSQKLSSIKLSNLENHLIIKYGC